MGIPAPHFTARLSVEEYRAYKEDELFLQRQAAWNAKAAIELKEKREPEFWWWQDEKGEWVGKCSGKKNPTTGLPCEATIKAVGLVHVEGKRVRSSDGVIKVSDEAHYCMECRPRIFGRVSGRPSRGIPMWGSDNADYEGEV